MDIHTLVDELIAVDARVKQLEARRAQLKTIIRAHLTAQRQRRLSGSAGNIRLNESVRRSIDTAAVQTLWRSARLNEAELFAIAQFRLQPALRTLDGERLCEIVRTRTVTTLSVHASARADTAPTRAVL